MESEIDGVVMEGEVFTIGGAADGSGVRSGTLREYEKLGLLKPARDSAGRRIFSRADVLKAREIANRRRAARGSGLRRGRPGGD